MLHELAYFTKTRTEQSSPLQQAVWRLGELETYVACLTALAEAAALPGVRSAGMRALAEFVRERQQDEVYPAPGGRVACASRRPEAARQHHDRHQPRLAAPAVGGDAAARP